MKRSALILVLLTAVTSFAKTSYEGGGQRYPSGPNQELTPGDVCHQPDTYRYDERIAYCERDVETSTKNSIIAQYDQELGYRIGSMPRGQFKIDHYIPLCMGGSNDRSNLWPQHQSVYKITDQLEQQLCEKMAQGKMLQAEAIQLIKHAKNNLDEAPSILERARAM
jgi:hypothetical protein